MLKKKNPHRFPSSTRQLRSEREHMPQVTKYANALNYTLINYSVFPLFQQIYVRQPEIR